MSYIYTCQKCQQHFTIYTEGDYVCDCGNLFHYPSISPILKANLTTTIPSHVDSSNKNLEKHRPIFNKGAESRAFTNIDNCPLAKLSLILASVSLLFFGVLALPALIIGIAAQFMIADKQYNYKDNGFAVSGIALAVISLCGWGAWFTTLL